MAHFFCIFQALSFELNIFFDRSFPLIKSLAQLALTFILLKDMSL